MMMAHLMTVCSVDVTSDKKALFSWVGSLHVKATPHKVHKLEIKHD